MELVTQTYCKTLGCAGGPENGGFVSSETSTNIQLSNLANGTRRTDSTAPPPVTTQSLLERHLSEVRWFFKKNSPFQFNLVTAAEARCMP